MFRFQPEGAVMDDASDAPVSWTVFSPNDLSKPRGPGERSELMGLQIRRLRLDAGSGRGAGQELPRRQRRRVPGDWGGRSHDEQL